MLKTVKVKMGTSPVRFVIDFEQAMHRAISIAFPEAEIRECRFHLRQAWYRKHKQLKRYVLYQTAEEEVGKWFVSILGFYFKNPSKISKYFLDDLM